ncbi:MAG: lysophospholipid acyltransferase family protein [Patescibacteria group bacterium]|nr:lysophospholipid acyltransferase family protein [Patescibacteria group bacterium]
MPYKIKNYLSKFILHVNQRVFYYTFLYWLRHLFRTDVLHINELTKRLDRPIVVVSNHISRWDPFLILSSMRRSFYFRNLVWRIPAYHGFFGRLKYIHFQMLFLFLGVYPIGGKGSIEKKLENTINLLKNGHSTVFFPEGKRAVAGEKTKPKNGIGYVISHQDVYILPVNVQYSKRKQCGLGIKINSKARVVFGKIYKSEYFREKYDENAIYHGVMGSVFELENTLRPTS